MPSPSGLTPFVDISNCTYNGVTIFGVKRITHDRRKDLVLSKDNNKNRYVAGHEVFVQDTVTIESTDLNGLIAMAGVTGMHDLVFTCVVSSQNVATGTLANQTVTIKNVMWNDQRSLHEMKAEGTFSLSGIILGIADNSDPVTYAAAA